MSAAIIEMTDEVYFTENTRPICMPKEEYQENVGKSGILAGWGYDGSRWSTNMKEVDTFIIRNQDCKHMMNIQGKGVWQENDGLNFALRKAFSSR